MYGGEQLAPVAAARDGAVAVAAGASRESACGRSSKVIVGGTSRGLNVAAGSEAVEVGALGVDVAADDAVADA